MVGEKKAVELAACEANGSTTSWELGGKEASERVISEVEERVKEVIEETSQTEIVVDEDEWQITSQIPAQVEKLMEIKTTGEITKQIAGIIDVISGKGKFNDPFELAFTQTKVLIYRSVKSVYYSQVIFEMPITELDTYYLHEDVTTFSITLDPVLGKLFQKKTGLKIEITRVREGEFQLNYEFRWFPKLGNPPKKSTTESIVRGYLGFDFATEGLKGTKKMLDIFKKGVYAEFRNDYLPGMYDGLTKVGETTFTKIEFLEEGVEMTATADGGKYNTRICYNKDKVISVPRELVGKSIVVDIRLTKDYWKKKLKVRKMGIGIDGKCLIIRRELEKNKTKYYLIQTPEKEVDEEGNEVEVAFPEVPKATDKVVCYKTSSDSTIPSFANELLLEGKGVEAKVRMRKEGEKIVAEYEFMHGLTAKPKVINWFDDYPKEVVENYQRYLVGKKKLGEKEGNNSTVKN